MDKPVYFKEYRRQGRKGIECRDCLLGIIALALIVGGDIITSALF